MKAVDLIALLKDSRGALHGAYPRLVERLDAAIEELDTAQKQTKELARPPAPAAPSIPRRP